MIKTEKEKGVSLIITFFIMIIILAIVLFVSLLLYSGVKIVRNMGDSIVSFYAADSGVEKVLYYDRQVLPVVGVDSDTGDDILAARGLCSMYDSVANPASYCSPYYIGATFDQSVYCGPYSDWDPPQIYIDLSNPHAEPGDNPDGCNPAICNACEIYFNTTFNNREYQTKARVYPSLDGTSSNFEVESKGLFGTAQRQIKIFIAAIQPGWAINIIDACATPMTTSQGNGIKICANVHATIPGDTIGSVTADIRHYDSSGAIVEDATGLVLSQDAGSLCPLPSGLDQADEYVYVWNTTTGTSPEGYYVDVSAVDTLDPPNEKKQENLLPYPLCITSQ